MGKNKTLGQDQREEEPEEDKGKLMDGIEEKKWNGSD